MIIVIVESGLPNGDNLWMSRQRLHQLKMPVFNLCRIVRMDAEAGLDPVIGLCDGDAASHVVRTGSRSDCHNSANTRIPGTLNHIGPVLGIADIVKVRVRINEHYFNRAPLGISSWKPASTGGSPSPSDAATI